VTPTGLRGKRLVHLARGRRGISSNARQKGNITDSGRPRLRPDPTALQLHPHHTRLSSPHADRTPPQRGVRFVVGLHIGQHFVRPEVQCPQPRLPVRSSQPTLVQRRNSFGPFGTCAPPKELQLGAEQPAALRPPTNPPAEGKSAISPAFHM